jgi:hypothetical protein
VLNELEQAFTVGQADVFGEINGSPDFIHPLFLGHPGIIGQCRVTRDTGFAHIRIVMDETMKAVGFPALHAAFACRKLVSSGVGGMI